MVPAKSVERPKLVVAPDFRHYLREELLRRTRDNPKYSLRAFAGALGVQSGFLSKILNGQRRVTPKSIEKFGRKLGLTEDQIQSYLPTSAAPAELRTVAVPNFKNLAEDHFQVISDWYHFAILELATIKGFQPKPRWISAKLGLPIAETEEAIARLVRLGYVTIRRNGAWKLGEGHTTTLGIDIQTQALQKLQSQVLEMAKRALYDVPGDFRDQSTMTVAVDSDRLDEAKKMIRTFRRKLATYLETGEKRDSVYQLSVALYPVTKISTEAE